MTGNQIWIVAWLAVTVVAGAGVVAASRERWIAARAFIGWTLGVWGAAGTVMLLGWWPR